VYCVLHLSHEYALAFGINLIIGLLLILCLDTDLHFGQAFISNFIVWLGAQFTKNPFIKKN